MLGLWLGLGLGGGSGASLLLIADCRYAIRGDRVPVAGTGYTTFFYPRLPWVWEFRQLKFYATGKRKLDQK